VYLLQLIFVSGTLFIATFQGTIIVQRSMDKLRPALDSSSLKPNSIHKTYSITKAFTVVALNRITAAGRQWTVFYTGRLMDMGIRIAKCRGIIRKGGRC